MRKWWTTLIPRQRAGVAMFWVGTFVVLLSLPFPFLHRNAFLDPESITMGEWVYKMSVFFYEEPEAWAVRDFETFVRGPLAAGANLLSLAAIIPGAFLILLAPRSAVCCWIGRLFWLPIFAGGPPIYLFVVNESRLVRFGLGFWLWACGLLAVTVAGWVMACRRPRGVLPDGGASVEPNP